MMRAHRPPRDVLGIVLLMAAAGLAGCPAQEPQSPNPGLTNAVSPPQPPDLGRGAPRASAEGSYNIMIAEPLRKVCAGSVPFFEFDSSDTRVTDQPTMQSLADCMLSGPLKGRSIRLVGHTDPRGTPDYNEKLGLERADRVKRYLAAHGVDPSRVEVQSHGKDDASPEQKDWPKDRRVEIQLVR